MNCSWRQETRGLARSESRDVTLAKDTKAELILNRFGGVRMNAQRTRLILRAFDSNGPSIGHKA